MSMLDAITSIAFTALQWIATAIICLLMIIRYDLFIRMVVYAGLGIAVTAGLAVVALPLLFISPLLVPVAFVLVAVAPLWLVFR